MPLGIDTISLTADLSGMGAAHLRTRKPDDDLASAAKCAASAAVLTGATLDRFNHPDASGGKSNPLRGKMPAIPEHDHPVDL